MTEKAIQQALRRYTQNHRYVLENAYIFDWESDFFSITTTGTTYEFKIKCTKSDFKKDFEKPKHLYLQACYDNKSHVVKNKGLEIGLTSRWQNEPNTLLCTIRIGELALSHWYWFKNIEWRKRNEKIAAVSESFTHAEDSWGYWMKNEHHIDLHHEIVNVHAPFSHISIDEVGKYRLPAKFWYVCPEKLLSVESIPDYAGLIYFYPSGYTRMIKQAPVLHNRGMEGLDRILRDKFYWLSVHQQNKIDHLERLIADYRKTVKE
jgi:hypothetical protein